MSTSDATLGNMKAIAHFSPGRAYTYALCGLTIVGLMMVLVLHHPPGTTLRAYLASKGLFRYDYALFALVLGAYLVAKLLAVFCQLVFRDRCAIWVVNGNIRFVSMTEIALFSSIQTRNIESFSVGTVNFFPPKAIVFRTHSGVERRIPAWFLSEPADLIVARLRSEVGG